MVKAALFSAPAVAMAITVLLLNWVEASPGLAVAALAVVAAGGGVLFGIFADRLPEFPRTIANRRAAPGAR